MFYKRLLKLVHECRRYSKPKQCRFRCRMLELKQKPMSRGIIRDREQIGQDVIDHAIGQLRKRLSLDNVSRKRNR